MIYTTQMHTLVHAINIHFVRHTQLLNMLLLRQENMFNCVYIAITFQIVPLHYHYFQIFLYQIPLHLPFKLNQVLQSPITYYYNTVPVLAVL